MIITAVKIKDKVEIFADIPANNSDDSNLIANRVTFRKMTKGLYELNELGDGLLTLTMDQAKALHDSLTKILENKCTGS